MSLKLHVNTLSFLRELSSHSYATDVLLIHSWCVERGTDRWRDQRVHICQELETAACCKYSNLNNSFYWLECIDCYWFSNSFLKLSLPPSLCHSLLVSLLFLPPFFCLSHPCFHLCSAVQSVCLQLMDILAAASFHLAELLGFVCYFFCFCIEAAPAIHALLCVCVFVQHWVLLG